MSTRGTLKPCRGNCMTVLKLIGPNPHRLSRHAVFSAGHSIGFRWGFPFSTYSQPLRTFGWGIDKVCGLTNKDPAPALPKNKAMRMPYREGMDALKAHPTVEAVRPSQRGYGNTGQPLPSSTGNHVMRYCDATLRRVFSKKPGSPLNRGSLRPARLNSSECILQDQASNMRARN